jgi:hypothetical protein
LLEQTDGTVRFKGEAVVKIVKSERAETPGVALWTPWGLERPVDRLAQKRALKRILRRIEELRRLERVNAMTERLAQ